MAKSSKELGRDVQARKRELREFERECGIFGKIELVQKSIVVREAIEKSFTPRRGSFALTWARLDGEGVLLCSRAPLTQRQARRWGRLALAFYAVWDGSEPWPWEVRRAQKVGKSGA